MNLANMDFTNSMTLCAALVSSVTMISLILKLSAYKGLLTWMKNAAPRMALWMRHLATGSVLFVEFTFSAMIIVFGSSFNGLAVAAALLLFVVSLGTSSLFKRSGGCPCFGTMPYTKKFNSLSVWTFVLCTVLLLYFAASLLKEAMFYCAALVAMIVAALAFGRALVLNMFTGSPCNIQVVDELTASEIVGVAEDTTVLLFFLKMRCPACVTLIAYIQKMSAAFSDKVKFVIVIDGFSLSETVKMAEAFVVPDSKNVLKNRAKIFSSPTLISMNGKVQRKYVGLNACSQGISDLIYSNL